MAGCKKVEISIIIVSYNTVDLIGDCLNSIEAFKDCSKEIFVVDNASTDGSAIFIKNNYPSVHLIANTENKGFAAANNQALEYCEGRQPFGSAQKMAMRAMQGNWLPGNHEEPLHA